MNAPVFGEVNTAAGAAEDGAAGAVREDGPEGVVLQPTVIKATPRTLRMTMWVFFMKTNIGACRGEVSGVAQGFFRFFRRLRYDPGVPHAHPSRYPYRPL